MPEDDTVHVGNVTNHYEEKPGKPAASGLLKMALGAALVASGVGAGFGLPLLLDGGKDVIETKPEIRYLLDLSGGQKVDSEGNRE